LAPQPLQGGKKRLAKKNFDLAVGAAIEIAGREKKKKRTKIFQEIQKPGGQKRVLSKKVNEKSSGQREKPHEKTTLVKGRKKKALLGKGEKSSVKKGK